jgi:predicted nucleic acid-binding protein
MILLDTGPLYALVDRGDRRHREARELYARLVKTETLGVCLPVLTESWILVEARLGLHHADKLWEAVTRRVLRLIPVELPDLRLAFEIETRYSDAGLGLVDCVILALAERLRTPRIFTYDRRHFSLYRPSFAPALELLP